jgi:tetratricopeptide (TPR) repeat protein
MTTEDTLTIALQHSSPQVLAQTYNDAGNRFRTQHQLEIAMECYQLALRIHPTVETYNNLGGLYFAHQQLEEAKDCCQQALRLQPDAAEAYYNLGIVLQAQNQLESALEYYQQAVHLKPDYAAAYQGMVNILEIQLQQETTLADSQANSSWVRFDNFSKVVKSVSLWVRFDNFSKVVKSVSLQLKLAEIYYQLGVVYQQQQQLEIASEYYQKALLLAPTHADAYNNLGSVLFEQRQLEAAFNCYQQLLEMNPNSASIYNNLGSVLYAQNQVVAALECYHQALRLQPDYAEVYVNLCVVCADEKQLDIALEYCHRALHLQPELASAHFNHALILLKLGRFQEGWQEYVWQRQAEGTNFQSPHPQWDGTHLAGRRLLVLWEQGFGDTIQFVRYLSFIKGGTVILICRPALATLFQGVAGIDEFIIADQSVVVETVFDVWIHLMSLPQLFATTLDNIPATIPYVSPDFQKVATWRQRFNPLQLNIGIVWAGSPTYKGDYRRSCPVAHFASLANIPNVAFFSLQKGEVASQPVPTGLTLTSLSKELTDFSDTAAVIACLDLVISVDTAVAHLAGALGKPVWVLLPFASDWRWLTDREDSPWYPTMRLFRQPRPGDWDSVFAQVAKELARQREILQAVRWSNLNTSPASPQALAEIYNEAGNLFRTQHQLEIAMECYQLALRIHPTVETYNNLGGLYFAHQRLEEAEECCQQALRLQPKQPDAHFNYAMLLLKLGRFSEGWPEYEWRMGTAVIFELPQPKWDGTPLAGRRLLVHWEQGFGDTLQFIRYLPLIKGGTVIFVCRPPLATVCQGLAGIDELAIIEESAKEVPQMNFDAWITLSSLPYIFATTLDTIPASVPYLFPDLKKVTNWRPRFSPTSLNIGIVWAGSPTHPEDRYRSCCLVHFAPLANLPNLALFSLQKGEAASQLVSAALPITALSNDLNDFSDTAAVIACLDLVIAVDTAVVHLAGALGKPVWVLLPFAAEWRWLTDREDSPWYPTMRLFRQPRPGDWDSVFAQVVKELARQREMLPAVRWDTSQLSFPTSPKDLAKIYQTAGESFRRQKNLTTAIECYQQALRIQPSVESYNKLGGLYYAQNQLEAAKECCQQVLRLQPQQADAYYNLGVILQKQEQFETAFDCYQQAVRLHPGHIEAINNQGVILALQNQLTAAFQYFQQALRIQPTFANAHLYAGLILLKTGYFTEGWQEYEWRLMEYRRRNELSFKQPLWDGTPLAGRRLLVHWEQGFGDMLQFIRYLPFIKGGTVILACRSPLATVCQSAAGIDELVRVEKLNELPQTIFEVWLPILSLPRIFATTLENIPAAIPYLQPESAKVANWRHRFDPQRLNIGIAWAGDPSHPNDRNRSCALTHFVSLASLPNVAFFSLQKGEAASQPFLSRSHALRGNAAGTLCVVRGDTGRRASRLGIPTQSVGTRTATSQLVPVGLSLTLLSDELTDFSDTAAVIANLDIVIAVDTAIVHLAGALGKPVWVLLPFVAEWRWLTDREDSPWYPTMRLFRQPRRGDWDSVFAQVVKELARLRELLQAVRWSKTAVPSSPAALAQTYNEAGNVFRTQNQPEMAIASYQQALRIQSMVETYNNLGGLLFAQDQLEEAKNCCQQALRLQPDFAEAYYNLGGILQKQKQLDAAVVSYQQAVRLRPDYVEAINNLGAVFALQEQPEAALACYQQILRLNPHHTTVYNSIGSIFYYRNQLETALQCYQQALQLDPNLTDAYIGYACTLLKMGNFNDGWREFVIAKEKNEPLAMKQPQWDGTPLAGRRLLVHWEQGFGDTIQFIRYLPLLTGGTVILACQLELASLFRTIKGVDILITSGFPPEEPLEVVYDVWTTLLSLPAVFATTLDKIPASIPYLFPESSKVVNWRYYFDAKQLNVGIVWAGDPTNPNDHNRSCSLTHFASLANVSNLALFGLQKGKAASQPVPAGLPFTLLTEKLADFSDTAAVIACLDLVIAVDTSVAHLAGALGKPVWVLLPYASEWRWLMDREDSPWYPTMRLFRQPRPGDWESVFAKMVKELSRFYQEFKA